MQECLFEVVVRVLVLVLEFRRRMLLRAQEFRVEQSHLRARCL